MAGEDEIQAELGLKLVLPSREWERGKQLQLVCDWYVNSTDTDQEPL